MKTLKFLVFVVLALSMAAACSENNTPEQGVDNLKEQEVQKGSLSGEPEEGEPKEIFFTEYSLAKTSCQWIKRYHDNEVIVINSSEELDRYVTCTDNDYPAIDFSKFTLLLAHGTGTSSVVSVGCSRLQQISEQGYTMNVDLVLGNATVMSPWQVPIIVDKWREESTVELAVTTKYY
jgi:hypothetical protein